MKRELEAAGYKGEKIVVLTPTDIAVGRRRWRKSPPISLRQVGVNVDAQAMDWATLVQRRAKTEPVEQGGWSIFHTSLERPGHDRPGRPRVPARQRQGRAVAGRAVRRSRSCATHGSARRTWPRRKRWRDKLQLQAFEDVPYIPLGQYFIPTAYQANLTGMLQGSPVFWNISRA